MTRRANAHLAAGTYIKIHFRFAMRPVTKVRWGGVRKFGYRTPVPELYMGSAAAWTSLRSPFPEAPERINTIVVPA